MLFQWELHGGKCITEMEPAKYLEVVMVTSIDTTIASGDASFLGLNKYREMRFSSYDMA